MASTNSTQHPLVSRGVAESKILGQCSGTMLVWLVTPTCPIYFWFQQEGQNQKSAGPQTRNPSFNFKSILLKKFQLIVI